MRMMLCEAQAAADKQKQGNAVQAGRRIRTTFVEAEVALAVVHRAGLGLIFNIA